MVKDLVKDQLAETAVYAQEWAWVGLLVLLGVAAWQAYKNRKHIKEKARLVEALVNKNLSE